MEICDTQFEIPEQYGWGSDLKHGRVDRNRVISDNRSMNFRQTRFAIEYCVDYNATQAAKRAGYSETSSHDIGCQLLKNIEVLDFIKSHEQDIAIAAMVTPAWILAQYAGIAQANPDDLISGRSKPCAQCWPSGLNYDDPNAECALCGGEGRLVTVLKDTSRLTGSARKLFAGLKRTKDGIEVKMRDQDGALKMLAQHAGMIVERKELSGPGGGPLNVRAIREMTDEQLQEIIDQQLAAKEPHALTNGE